MVEAVQTPSTFPKRIFSGIQPSGGLTLGNYLGALKRFVEKQNEGTQTIYCLVDLHAISVWQDPVKLRQQTRELAAGFIASGIDPERSILFNQSQVSAHAELGWVFNCVARMGWLNRMTQFKDKAGKNAEAVSVGLFCYPNLMAADILVYHATHVPVGEDQKQHLELARDIAQKFNTDFDTTCLVLPAPVIGGPAARVMSLRDGTKKMSKSDPSDYSRINMTDDADTIALKFRKAKTDPAPLPGLDVLDEKGRVTAAAEALRPEAYNLLAIYAALSDQETGTVIGKFEGRDFAAFKRELTDLAVSVLGPIGAEMKRLLDHPAEIDQVLSQGAAKARAISEPILTEIERAVGFLPA